MDSRKRIMASCVALLPILGLDTLPLSNCRANLKDFTAATLYALDDLTIIPLLSALAVQGFLLKKDRWGNPRSTPYLYSFAGMSIACAALVSLVKYLGGNRSPDYLAVFFSCIIAVAIYVYIIVLRDH